MQHTIPQATEVPWSSRFPRDNARAEKWFPMTHPDGTIVERPPDDYTPYSSTFSLPAAHSLKRRVPHTSVVNRVSDALLWGRALSAPTAADLVVRLNTMALVVYTVLLVFAIYFGYYKNEKNMDLHTMRLAGGWNFSTVNMTSADIDAAWPVVDAEMTLSVTALLITILCVEIFAVLLQLMWGLWERWWYVYWRQLDDCFPFWRWIDWAFSDGIMVLTLALVLGVREVGLLGCCFVLTWICYVMGFVNELYSRPRNKPDLQQYAWAKGPREFSEKGPYTVKYGEDDMALKLISQESWEGDRPLWGDGGRLLPGNTEFIESQRWSNYTRRLLPYALGWIPGMTPWIILAAHYFRRQQDLRDAAGYEPFTRTPPFPAKPTKTEQTPTSFDSNRAKLDRACISAPARLRNRRNRRVDQRSSSP
jgi:hypothetical protein